MHYSQLSGVPQRQLFLAFLAAFILVLLLVHGMRQVFPESPVFSYPKSSLKGDVKPWLILLPASAEHLQRRQIIRDTWMRYYKHMGVFDAKFVISDPGHMWAPLIERENRTFGDLMLLDHRPNTDDDDWASKVKPMETLKQVVHWGRKYAFVSKVDMNSFIDAKTFWEVFLAPRLEDDNNDAGEPRGIYIGRALQHSSPFKYASGQFYTLSWDMVENLVSAWRRNHIVDEREDALIGRLLYESHTSYNITVLGTRLAFDYDDESTRGDGTAFNKESVDPDRHLRHAVAVGAINPSRLNSDEHYLKVAKCFNEDGLDSPRKGLDWNKYNNWIELAWTREHKGKEQKKEKNPSR